MNLVNKLLNTKVIVYSFKEYNLFEDKISSYDSRLNQGYYM